MDSKSISKFLSLLLRHQPDLIKLNMDKEGWVRIDEIIENAYHFKKLELTFDEIIHVVQTNDKKRFILSKDKLYIRANQGHSVEVDLNLERQIPPVFLFHGTATRFLDSILADGLKPMSRQFVHLSSTIDTAVNVGQRHGKPVVLQISAKQMDQDGFYFYLSENCVWLVKEVPKKYITVKA